MIQSHAGPSGPSDRRTGRKSSPPIFASIGTVLIDAFDSPPRPILDADNENGPNANSNPPKGLMGLPTPPTPPTPIEVQSQAHAPTPSKSFFRQLPIVASHLVTPKTSPVPSAGPSTPQLSLDDSPLPNADEVYEMLGGGALYALVGARLWLGPDRLRTLVDRAPMGEESDVPPEAEDKLNNLGEDIWVWNRGENTKMTRARIRYEGDVRFFQHVVKAPHRRMSQLLDSPLCGAQYLHISPPWSPEDVSGLLDEITSLREADPTYNWEPNIVFEPTPPSCHPGQKEWLEKIVPFIEVLSPNHEEIFSILSIPPKEITDPDLKPTVEGVIRHFIHHVGIGKDGKGIMIVRCGRLGACVGTKEGGLRWCPAYFEGEESKTRVKDVTGAGNSFLGGYCAGLSLSGNDPYEALLYATVSASFVIEQFGLPSLSQVDGVERWNDDLPHERLEVLRKRFES
ncbi:hypothetical protein I302_102627 [Kwoniella bestiolae CBS 10118]|uniref:PfkB family carbohydrate kinase superfamily protein n=1 Tax=Kwoniella bestiolae CBS 10118 TaxID=1296100 RepID=A0A1B9GFH8_9TREE|nr:pfkB family carbohydrate kinase superfamily protein [Kwoniella bestiolae CBS 10118]OCF29803.1 pfkB family carbohydrate kinase superfamily protein [Kwoniella bestiolae CBS 10118]